MATDSASETPESSRRCALDLSAGGPKRQRVSGSCA